MKITLYYLTLCMLVILFMWCILGDHNTKHITHLSLPEEYKLIEVGDTMYLNQSSNGDYTLGFGPMSKFDTQVIITP